MSRSFTSQLCSVGCLWSSHWGCELLIWSTGDESNPTGRKKQTLVEINAARPSQTSERQSCALMMLLNFHYWWRRKQDSVWSCTDYSDHGRLSVCALLSSDSVNVREWGGEKMAAISKLQRREAFRPPKWQAGEMKQSNLNFHTWRWTCVISSRHAFTPFKEKLDSQLLPLFLLLVFLKWSTAEQPAVVNMWRTAVNNMLMYWCDP